MFSFLLPKAYLKGAGILRELGTYAHPYGQVVYVLGGKRALKATLEPIRATLADKGISFVVDVFSGYPTEEKITAYAKAATLAQAKLIIAVGGGRALDVGKAAAEQANVPVFTVPTVAATCAAWANLSIVYDDLGRYVRTHVLKENPHYLFVDPKIIGTADRRYLHAGIADTLAKWYETTPNLAPEKGPLALRLQALMSEFTVTYLEDILKTHQGQDLQAEEASFEQIIDAVIFLAGLCNSVKDEHNYYGFAHPFYNALTHEAADPRPLHGESVFFGLLVQWVLEGKAEKDIAAYAKGFLPLRLPLSLTDLGILPTHVPSLAKKTQALLKGTAFEESFSEEKIAHAILQAHDLGVSLTKALSA